MARLLPGENPKIDKINDLVLGAKDGDMDNIASLLELFNPMILKTCKKWSNYFDDEYHKIKSFNELVSDAQYWFIHYTCSVYTVDGSATYNKFIKDHIDQRIRYIYECEIKYYTKNIFPDPNKNTDIETDILEDVIHKYSSNVECDDTEDDYIDNFVKNSRTKLAHSILEILENRRIFNDRERSIFTEIMFNGVTHEYMGIKLNISRTRVTQILRKVKSKLYEIMINSQDIWNLIDDADITIEEGKW